MRQKDEVNLNRREMLGGLGGLAALGFSRSMSSIAESQDSKASQWPFLAPVLSNQWTRIHVDGFPAPVTGYIYEGATLESGVPLGALGTGYITLDGNGKLGFSSIFNDLVPPKRINADWLFIEAGKKNVPLSTARIAYWGHYPIADLRAQLNEVPLGLGIRAFTPFIVGDAAASNTPAALFELELCNLSQNRLPLVLHLKFPVKETADNSPERGELVVRGDLGFTPGTDQGSYLYSIELQPHSSKRIRFAVGWYAPVWRDSGGEPRMNRYSQRFASAVEVAEFALHNQDQLHRRVLAWQHEIYRSSFPEWLQDGLVQGFYSLAKNSVWIARTRKDDWWGDDGWLTHSESHTGCPIVETMVCRMHGHFALLYFFPELEETTLDGFRHYQISSGEVPFAFGLSTSMRDPRYTCQHPLNSGEYAQMVYQLYQRTDDRRLLSKFYESCKRGIRFQYSLDPDSCGLVHDQSHALPKQAWPANQFYDIWPWQGTSSYVGGIWLGTLSAGAALAEAMGDTVFELECKDRLKRAKQAFEANLWNGSYYRLWNDKEFNEVSEICLANQLMAVWCARVAGLPDPLPEDHIEIALDSVERLNMRATAYGLIDGVTPDGKPFDTGLGRSGDHAKNIFFGENLCAAMTFLYHGRREVGLEIGRRLYEAVAIKNRSPWNQRCLLNGLTGMPQWGEDYYSDLIIWALPMGLAGQSVRQFSRGSGLISDMLNAGKTG